jgi:nucleoside-diphosphate-sugar epimerase
MVAERVVMSYGGVMTTTIIRPATVCGYSPRMRLDLVVNLLTMQALTRGAITVLGGDQTRPNIHIDDLVDLYLFAFEQRLAGVYNAGFENIAVRDIAALITRHLPADVTVLPSNDPRSYSICSDRLLATGFRPRKDVATAIREMVAAYRDGRITDDVRSYNVNWMKQHNFG